MSTNARSSRPGSRSRWAHIATRCAPSTDSSCRAWPKVNSRNSVPIVEGAYTPPNKDFIPPLRTMSASSMQSAPTHIAAISVTNFGAGLAAPDLIRASVICTFSLRRRDRPACSASVITGTSPAYDTRLSSSNTAESGANLWDTCTGSAFLVPGDCCVRNTNHPSSEGTFLISTPQTQPIRPWIEAKRGRLLLPGGRRHRRHRATRRAAVAVVSTRAHSLFALHHPDMAGRRRADRKAGAWLPVLGTGVDASRRPVVRRQRPAARRPVPDVVLLGQPVGGWQLRGPFPVR